MCANEQNLKALLSSWHPAWKALDAVPNITLDTLFRVLWGWGAGTPFMLTVPRKWILPEGTDWCCSPEGCVDLVWWV